MRLTLRTMLAYMDDVLEPADAQEIGQRIEHSEYAAEKLQMIRGAIRRPRLGAPPLSGRQMGFDPNTVAEYLDNTLTSERVPEFERACLESEVHLAEVACCHQILALVLGEPPDVQANLRQRMHGLIHLPDESHEAPPPPAAPELARAVGSLSESRPRRAAEVPEELRQARGTRRWQMLGIGFLGLLLIGVIVMAVQPNGFRRTAQTTKPDNIPPIAPDTAGGLQQPGNLAPTSPANADAVNASPPVAGQAIAAEQPVGNQVTDDAEGAADAPADEPAVEPGDLAADAEMPADAPGDEGIPAVDDQPAREPAGDQPAAPAGEGAAGDMGSVGRYITNDSVLLRLAAPGHWERVATQGSLAAGSVIATLPTFEANLTLSNAASLQLQGDAAVQLESIDGQAALRVFHGRIVLATLGRSITKIPLYVGDRIGILSCGPGDTTIGLEAHPTQRAGSDLTKVAPHWNIDLYVVGGKATWQEKDTPARELSAPAHFDLAAAAPDQKKPWWWPKVSLSPIDKVAAGVLEERLRQALPGDDPPRADRKSVSLLLLELARDRRREVRALALHSLAVIGVPDHLVEALNDPADQKDWMQHADVLQQVVLRSPEQAALVRQAFEVHRGERANDLFRMLCGYDNVGLQRGDAAQLVEYLEHADLDFRVLGYWNLRNITRKNFVYRPEYPEAKRRPQVQRWKQLLNSGQILVAKPFNPVDPPAAAAEPPANGDAPSPANGDVPAPPADEPVDEGAEAEPAAVEPAADNPVDNEAPQADQPASEGT